MTQLLRFQFRQLITNLITNSLKFTVPEITPVINISGEIIKGNKLDDKKFNSSTDYCHIVFTDNGIGFESKNNELIFDVFQRLHGVHEYKGPGMGLAICKRIVENHKGIITASGSPGKGARFGHISSINILILKHYLGGFEVI